MEPAPNIDEKDLLLKLREGDYRAFEALYDRYRIRLAANIHRLVKSEGLAEDLLQDLFMKVWETRAQLDAAKSFRSYLFRICENLVYDLFRRAARDKRMQEHFMQHRTEIYRHIEEGIAYKETAAQLEQAIASLPPQCRKVFELFKIEGKSYQEISELLGISVSTVNNHVARANRLLKAGLSGGSALLVYGCASAMLSGL